MSRTLSPLPRALGAMFTTQQARAAGAGPQRLRAGDVVQVSRGLHRRTDAAITASAFAIALGRGDPQVVVTGPTAPEVHRMPLPFRVLIEEGGRVCFSCEKRRTDCRRIRWRERTHDAGETSLLAGVRVMTRVRTRCDPAEVLTIDELVFVADHLLRLPRPRLEGRTQPYATGSDLERAITRWGRPWSAKLREALALAHVGSDSPAETSLRLGLMRAGLPEPALNVMIEDDGVRLGEPDLHWKDWKVCVEHEGPRHLERAQQEKDIGRTERRTNAGWIEVRTTASDLHHGAARAARRVADAMRRHGWKQ